MTPESTLRADSQANGSAIDAQAGAAAGFTGSAPREHHRPVRGCGSTAPSAGWFLAQCEDGYWWGELEADTTLESDYIPYLHLLGKLSSDKTKKLGKLRPGQRQLPDGGWGLFPGGASELNATVKAYVGLRLAGDSASAPHLQAAKRRKSTNWVAWSRPIRTCASTWRCSARSSGATLRQFRPS